MVNLSSLRNKIAQRIFTADLMSSAVLSSLVTPSQNKWGDEVASYSSGATIDVVPFLYIKSRLSYQPFGDVQQGDVDFVVKYDVTLQPRDKLTWQGTDHLITEVDDSAFLGNGLVVQVIRCRKMA